MIKGSDPIQGGWILLSLGHSGAVRGIPAGTVDKPEVKLEYIIQE